MKAWILLVGMLLAAPASGQDNVAAQQDLAALKARGVRAEIRSKTTKRNPETGHSMMAMVEAYTKGVIADAKDDLIFFVAEDDDTGWLRTNSVALIEPAGDLISRLEADGVDVPGLRALNEKWFPAEPVFDDEASVVARERAMKQMGMPIVVSMAEFPIDDEGGVRPSFGVKNIAEEVIEQVRFEMIAFSNRGDVVRDRDSGLATQVAILDAVIRPGDTALFKYSDGPLWVNRTSECVEVRKIEVTFRGGTTQVVDYQIENLRLLPQTYRVMGECTRQGL